MGWVGEVFRKSGLCLPKVGSKWVIVYLKSAMDGVLAPPPPYVIRGLISVTGQKGFPITRLATPAEL